MKEVWQTGGFEKIRRRVDLARAIFSLLSAAAFTAFTLVMLFKDWGQSIFLYIVLGFVGAYIIIFATLIIVACSKGNRLGASLKNYKSGLKILKAVLRLISLSITVSVLSITVFSNANAFFRFIVFLAWVTWAVFQIFYQIHKLRKRHMQKKEIKGVHQKKLRKNVKIIKKRK